MLGRAVARGFGSPAAAGGAVGLAGAGLVAVGLWARREATAALARERVTGLGEGDRPVTSAAGARELAELIRRNTVESAGGRTYAETDAYLDADGNPTPDAGKAARDERTGAPLENPAHALWLQSTTLQTALMQAYMALRLAELTVAVGASFLAAGAGIAAAARRAGG